MNHYLEIKTKPDAEMRQNELLNKVFAKIHKALFDVKSANVGISFPNYKVLLGDTIRLHGTDSSLSQFSDGAWLGGLSGYCQISELLEVPGDAKHRTVSRWQPNMSDAALRRLIKRAEARGEPISEDEIKAYKAKMFKQQMTELPYLELQSGSNGHKHRRYIQFGELVDDPIAGEFDQFGLSKTATVPWF